MLQIMLTPLRRYADFHGRSGREEFWLFMLFNYILAMAYSAAVGLLFLLFALMDMDESDMIGALFILFIPYALYSLYLFVPALAVTVRRLHDTDRSGWSILLGLIPLIGSIFLLLWYATPGTRGANRFGAPPPSDAAQAFA
jgi:uncharacterized membrane protein YhaH (DUF805 family)